MKDCCCKVLLLIILSWHVLGCEKTAPLDPFVEPALQDAALDAKVQQPPQSPAGSSSEPHLLGGIFLKGVASEALGIIGDVPVYLKEISFLGFEKRQAKRLRDSLVLINQQVMLTENIPWPFWRETLEIQDEMLSQKSFKIIIAYPPSQVKLLSVSLINTDGVSFFLNTAAKNECYDMQKFQDDDLFIGQEFYIAFNNFINLEEFQEAFKENWSVKTHFKLQFVIQPTQDFGKMNQIFEISFPWIFEK